MRAYMQKPTIIQQERLPEISVQTLNKYISQQAYLLLKQKRSSQIALPVSLGF